MQKVYLLLRNNQQTGPHSLEELLQLNLKPFDLIWVEGKSYGWSYPTEVDTLKTFVTPTTTERKESHGMPPSKAASPVTDTNANKKIFVSLPVGTALPSASSSSTAGVDALEHKAEELRKRVQSYNPQAQEPLQEDIKTNYARSLNSVEKEYTSWIYQKKIKKKNFISTKYSIVASIIAVGLVGGWWAGKAVFSKPEISNISSVMQSNIKEPAAAFDLSSTTELPAAVATNNIKLQKQTVTPNSKKAKEKKDASVVNITKERILKTEPGVVLKEPTNEQEENSAPVITEEKSEPAVAEKPQEKKRSLKELFGGLFKKNKKEEPAQQEPKSADNSNNERNATHRGEESAVGSNNVDLLEQVEIKMNKSDDDWMMGVQGLKLTLYNRSTATLKTAAVDVLYYSEQNSLLEKKRIQFSNIAPKKSQTVAAPDHRMADHVDYKIVNATGVEDAYAKQ